MSKFVIDKVRKTCEILKRMSEETVCQIEEMKISGADYKKPSEVRDLSNVTEVLKRGDRLSGRDKHFWLGFEVTTPKTDDDCEFRLEFTTGHEGEWDALNPQGMVYLNGKLVQGIDINHRTVILEAGTKYDVLVYFYVGMIECDTMFVADLKCVNLTAEKLYYDIFVPYNTLCCIDNKKDYNYIRTLKHLEIACNIVDFRNPGSEEFYASVKAASEYLKNEYYEKECGGNAPVVSYVGHSHIDVAWEWTTAQTREKIQRTAATALRLMEKYPEYIFMMSQPQLYQFLKEEEPDIYEQVKQRVSEGRWEVEGAMWLEADCNLTSGESLIRQIIHGKKFMKDEFGVDSHILFLPDVFGYSAALPQILKKANVDKFLTTKIGWSETNVMPNDTFMWEGVDGTEIFTYFLSGSYHEWIKKGEFNTSYVGKIEPQMHLGTWERYQQKDFNDDVLLTFGFGDGGGGPTAEMIENERRLKYGLPGMPKAQMTTLSDFLDRAEKNFTESCKKLRKTPKWVGELYLELHRGTYTSIAKNKKKNRECEFLCQEAESLSVMNGLLFGGQYPKDTFDRNWKRMLLNQFHDVIPGSSIKEVYEDSDRDYEAVYNEVGGVKNECLKKIADNVSRSGLLVYNPNSHKTSGYVECGESLVYAEDIPAFGWRVIEGKAENANITVADKTIESPHYKILFDDNMNIVSLYDKDNDRECVEQGKTANQLRIFEDYPREWDNWEITDYYKQKMWEVNDVDSVEPVDMAGAKGFKIVRKYMNSTIIQKVLVYEKSRRIDFVTEADWHEHHVLLKAAFPTTIHTNKANYEIQFGNVERPNHENTSWDKAKFEVCAQKWGDLSEEGYGISVLNNCKYGYSASGNEMSLTLIKCGTFPNEEADQGHHSFTYSLYPHKDGFKQGGTIDEAYLLNRPMEAVPAKGEGELPEEYSLVTCDNSNIIIETVKQAEDGEGVVVRLYDAWNMKSKANLKFGFEAKQIFLCDLMENPTEEIGSGNSVSVDVSNFEIVTLLIKL